MGRCRGWQRWQAVQDVFELVLQYPSLLCNIRVSLVISCSGKFSLVAWKWVSSKNVRICWLKLGIIVGGFFGKFVAPAQKLFCSTPISCFTPVFTPFGLTHLANLRSFILRHLIFGSTLFASPFCFIYFSLSLSLSLSLSRGYFFIYANFFSDATRA